MFRRKKNNSDSLKCQVDRTQRAVHELDKINNQLFVSMLNMNQQKGVTVKK